jgi:hypothetical protein
MSHIKMGIPGRAAIEAASHTGEACMGLRRVDRRAAFAPDQANRPVPVRRDKPDIRERTTLRVRRSRASPILGSAAHMGCDRAFLGGKMAPTDFLLLYQELGLVPGCSIDELKRAYRRCISRLHPDRPSPSNSVDPVHAAERLQQLTQLYGAAIDFHRRYGRLPGAAVARRTTTGIRAPSPRATTRSPHRRGKTIVIATGIAIVSSFLLYRTSDDGSAPERATAPDHAQKVKADDARPRLDETKGPRGLKLGMRMQDVLGIEGEPVMRNDDQWTYGPSWIAFEKGRVSSWYSSPLRPLRASILPLPPLAARPQDQE